MTRAEKKILKQFGSHINRLRVKKGWTLQVVADKMDTGKSRIHNIETGKTNPSLLVLIKLAKTFEISFGDLRNYKEVKEESSNLLEKEKIEKRK